MSNSLLAILSKHRNIESSRQKSNWPIMHFAPRFYTYLNEPATCSAAFCVVLATLSLSNFFRILVARLEATRVSDQATSSTVTRMLCEPYFLGGKKLELVFANKMPPSIALALHSGQKAQMSDIKSSQHDMEILSLSYDKLRFNSTENHFACAKTSSSFYNVLAIGTAICVCRGRFCEQFKGGLMVSKQQEMGFCRFMSRLILMLKLTFLLKTSVFPLVHSYDILFVHNMGTRSHLITLKPVVEELLRRNHSVTSIFFQVFWLLLFHNVF